MNSAFRIDAYKEASSEKEIAELVRASQIPVPEDYLGLIRKMDSPEILINKTQYVRIWGAARALELNDANQIQKYFPVSLAIGDDEEGGALILTNGALGFGLYKSDFGDMDPETAIFIAPSLSDFLINAIGVDVFNMDDEDDEDD